MSLDRDKVLAQLLPLVTSVSKERHWKSHCPYRQNSCGRQTDCLPNIRHAPRASVVSACREEAEKRNVWVAWLNLEARHGEPPQEAVMALFRRALPYTDAKRLYLALLSILEASQLVRSLLCQ